MIFVEELARFAEQTRDARLSPIVRRAAAPVRIAVHGRSGVGRGTVETALADAGVSIVERAHPADVHIVVIAEAPKPEDRALLAAADGPAMAVLNKADLSASHAWCASIGVPTVPMVGLLARVTLDAEMMTALRLFVTADFSYTVENLIQAGKKGLTVTTVPITVNATVNRPSRLHNGNWNFIKRQAAIIARTYSTYEPLKTFSYLALPFLLIGVVLLGNALYVFLARLFIDNYPRSNFQSLIAGGVALILGFVIFLFGIIADRIGGVRRVNDEQLYRLRAQAAADERWRRELSARLDEIEQKLEIEN